MSALDDIIQSAGFNPNDFQPSPPHFTATANPQAIRHALSQPDTVYAAIEEDSPQPVSISVPSENVEVITVEDAAVVETTDTATATNGEFTDSDWNDILESVGFHSGSAAQQVQEDSANAIDGHLEEDSEEDGGEEDGEVEREYGSVVNTPNSEQGSGQEESQSQSDSSFVIHSSQLIPPNSPTLLIDDSTSRFSGAEWYNEIQKANIIIAGCGGIGSNLAFQIARMHPASLFLYDDDNVEFANMSGQLFSRNDVGRSKVSAIVHMISSYTNTANAFAVNSKFTMDTEAGDIMMCGFDSMSARSTFFSAWEKHLESKTEEEKKRCLYLDGRLSIDTLQVFAVTGDDMYNRRKYLDEFLFSDSEADATVCSLKQTTYLACMIASVMTNLFTNFIANSLDPILPYDLPFFTEYDAQNMIFKTQR